MPIRLFDQLDIIGDDGGTYGETPYNIRASGSVISPNFSDINVTGSGSDSLYIVYNAGYLRTGFIDFSRFPAIPPNAVISKVSFRCPISGIGASHDENPSSVTASVDIRIAVQVGGPLVSPILFIQLLINDSSVCCPPSTDANASDSGGGSFVDYIGPFTYDQLVDQFSKIHFDIYFSCGAGAGSGGSHDVDATAIISNFQLEVTYTSGPFSWYLETHPDTIGGQPVIIVDDIVPVDEGDVPPAGSTFYGTSTDFPDESDIPLYDWYYPPTGTVVNQPIPPGSGWILQLVDHVGDLQFDMALESVIVLMTNPSGIYTLVEGQTHDTLYERFTGVPSINVKIPDPFGKTGFIP